MDAKNLITDLIEKYFFPKEDVYELKRLTEKSFSKLSPNPEAYLKEKRLEILKANYTNRRLGMALSFWVANGCPLLAKEQIKSYIVEALNTQSAEKYCVSIEKQYIDYVEEEVKDFAKAYLDFVFYSDLLASLSLNTPKSADFEDYFSTNVINRARLIETLKCILDAPNGKKNFAISLACLHEAKLLNWMEFKSFSDAIERKFGDSAGTRKNLHYHLKNYLGTTQKMLLEEKESIKKQLNIG